MNSPIREGYDVSTGIFISGMNLTHDVTVEAEPGVIITPESITVDKVNASEDGVRVGVRFTPELGTTSKVITVKSEGADPVTATIKYTVTPLVKPELTTSIFTDEGLTQPFEDVNLIPNQDYYLKLSIQVNDYANRSVNISAIAKSCNLAFATNPGGEFKNLTLEGGKFTTDNFMLQIGGVATKNVVFRITPNEVGKDTYLKATFNLNYEDQQIATVSKEFNIKFVPEKVANIAEFIKKGSDKPVTIEGEVMVSYTRGYFGSDYYGACYYFQDETGGLCYRGFPGSEEITAIEGLENGAVISGFTCTWLQPYEGNLYQVTAGKVIRIEDNVPAKKITIGEFTDYPYQKVVIQDVQVAADVKLENTSTLIPFVGLPAEHYALPVSEALHGTDLIAGTAYDVVALVAGEGNKKQLWIDKVTPAQTAELTVDNDEFDLGHIAKGVEKEFEFTVKGVKLQNKVTFAGDGFTFTPSEVSAEDAMADEGVKVTAKFTASDVEFNEEDTKTFTVNSEGLEPISVTVAYQIASAPIFTVKLFENYVNTKPIDGTDLSELKEYYFRNRLVGGNLYSGQKFVIKGQAKGCTAAWLKSGVHDDFAEVTVDADGYFETQEFVYTPATGSGGPNDIQVRIIPDDVDEDTPVTISFALYYGDEEIDSSSKEYTIIDVPYIAPEILPIDPINAGEIAEGNSKDVITVR